MDKHTKKEILAAVTLLTEVIGTISTRGNDDEIAIVWRRGVSFYKNGELLRGGVEHVAEEIFAMQEGRQ